MSLFDKQISQVLSNVAVGIGAALVIQLVVMGVVSLMRPLAKVAIRGGFVIRDAATGAYSIAGSQMGKLTGMAGTGAEAEPKVKPLRRSPKAKPDSPSLH
jgi:hypothetical protein